MEPDRKVSGNGAYGYEPDPGVGWCRRCRDLRLPSGSALPDPAPVPTAEGPAPSAETPAPAAPAEKPASPPVTDSPAAAPEAKAEQLDQLLAPIALYPDALLAQILMAATYPLEIVKADRWLQDPAHANLQGDQLAAALEAEAWDPSVKSLVPFPRILRMMDAELDWTEQLGNAVVAQQADVMDAIQRLRHQAAAAGTLWSNAEQQVTTERQGIVIEPANPEFIYPPVYSPAVYGPWPYPDYPPLDISPDDYGTGPPVPFDIGFGVGVAVVQPLWHWCVFDWAQRRNHSTLRSSMPSITAGAGQEQTLAAHWAGRGDSASAGADNWSTGIDSGLTLGAAGSGSSGASVDRDVALANVRVRTRQARAGGTHQDPIQPRRSSNHTTADGAAAVPSTMVPRTAARPCGLREAGLPLRACLAGDRSNECPSSLLKGFCGRLTPQIASSRKPTRSAAWPARAAGGQARSPGFLCDDLADDVAAAVLRRRVDQHLHEQIALRVTASEQPDMLAPWRQKD